MNRRRLDAESLRDAVLVVSGKLDLTMGGPGFELFRFKDDHSPIYDHTGVAKINDPENWRRTVYRFAVRSVPNPFLECLDCRRPEHQHAGAQHHASRPSRAWPCSTTCSWSDRPSTSPSAAGRRSSDEPGRQIERRIAWPSAAQPTAEERDALTAYVKKHGLANACRLLFNTNEFLFVD